VGGLQGIWNGYYHWSPLDKCYETCRSLRPFRGASSKGLFTHLDFIDFLDKSKVLTTPS
jgi:hypothetical protein